MPIRPLSAVLFALMLAPAASLAAGAQDRPADAADTVSYFETDHGSVYLVQGDGTTVRYMAVEQGTSDHGWQPRSSATVYVDTSASDGLISDVGPATRWMLDQKSKTVARGQLTASRDSVEAVTPPASYTTTPEKGRSPVELFDPSHVAGAFKGLNVGHPIVRVSREPIPLPAAK